MYPGVIITKASFCWSPSCCKVLVGVIFSSFLFVVASLAFVPYPVPWEITGTSQDKKSWNPKSREGVGLDFLQQVLNTVCTWAAWQLDWLWICMAAQRNCEQMHMHKFIIYNDIWLYIYIICIVIIYIILYYINIYIYISYINTIWLSTNKYMPLYLWTYIHASNGFVNRGN